MKSKNYKENYENDIKGFNYVSFDNIRNLNSKLKSIGLHEDLVTSRSIIYLFLIKYLGVITKDQLCELTHLLKRDIHMAIKNLNGCDSNKSNFLVNIESDKNNSESVYYTATKSAVDELSFYCDKEELRTVNVGSKINHFSKINDLYLSLFKFSDCTKITIDYEVDFSEGMFSDKEEPLKNKIMTDAVINATFNGTVSSIYLELDNGTETLSTLKKKVESYLNCCLHKRSIFSDKVNYLVFKLDTQLNKNHIWFCDSNVLKSEKYIANMKMCENFKKKRKEAKECKDEEDLINFIKCNNIDIGGFEFTSDTYTANRNRFCNYLSSLKSEYEFRNENLRRKKSAEYVRMCVKGRIDKLKSSMSEDLNVRPFYFDSIESIYQDINKRTTYAAMYEKMDGRSVLLRTNFMCGGTEIDKWFNKLVFNKDDKLIEMANEIRKVDDEFTEDTIREQKYIKLGRETLCFSNVIDDSDLYEPYVNYALLMPTVSVSDFARLQYICNSCDNDFEDGLGGNYLIIFIVVNSDKDFIYYNELISKYKSVKRHIAFMVHKIDLF